MKVDFEQLTRHVFASSSCGLCGKASIEAVHQHFAPITSKVESACGGHNCGIARSFARRAENLLPAREWGLHAAAIFTSRAKAGGAAAEGRGQRQRLVDKGPGARISPGTGAVRQACAAGQRTGVV